MLHYMTTEFGNASSTDHILRRYFIALLKPYHKHAVKLLELVGCILKRSNFLLQAQQKSINLAIQGNSIKAN